MTITDDPVEHTVSKSSAMIAAFTQEAAARYVDRLFQENKPAFLQAISNISMVGEHDAYLKNGFRVVTQTVEGLLEDDDGDVSCTIEVGTRFYMRAYDSTVACWPLDARLTTKRLRSQLGCYEMETGNQLVEHSDPSDPETLDELALLWRRKESDFHEHAKAILTQLVKDRDVFTILMISGD